MSGKRYSEEFKSEAIKQILVEGYGVSDVASRLGVSSHSLYAWMKQFGPNAPEHKAHPATEAKVKHLEKELKRVIQERDILKKGRSILREPVQLRYAFIKDNKELMKVRPLCRLLEVHPSGYYAWLKQTTSSRALSNQRLTKLIKQSWLDSGSVYGYRKIHSDLEDIGEQCGINRVHRLMSSIGIRAQVGYRIPRHRADTTHTVVANSLDRNFSPLQPNASWVTDITYIRTYEGWLYLAVVIDLFSRKVIGWSMQSRMTKALVLDALLMAIWQRKPLGTVTVHSDQGSQYTSKETRFQRFTLTNRP